MTNWQDGSMILRWTASTFLATEKNFRRIMGHEQLWILKAYLDESQEQQDVAREQRPGSV